MKLFNCCHYQCYIGEEGHPSQRVVIRRFQFEARDGLLFRTNYPMGYRSHGDYGRASRMDNHLRPRPRSSQLTRSVSSANVGRRYYERWNGRMVFVFGVRMTHQRRRDSSNYGLIHPIRMSPSRIRVRFDGRRQSSGRQGHRRRSFFR